MLEIQYDSPVQCLSKYFVIVVLNSHSCGWPYDFCCGTITTMHSITVRVKHKVFINYRLPFKVRVSLQEINVHEYCVL